MEFIGRQVEYKNLITGKTETGEITGVSGSIITASFPSGEKKYSYPLSFDKGMVRFVDEDASEKARDDIQKAKDEKSDSIKEILERKPEPISGDFPENTLRFSRKKKEYEQFSNFYPCTIEYEGITYSNSEAAWQSLKTLNMEERKSFGGLSGSLAKREGRKVKLREDWEFVKFRLMVEICLAKFSQNPELKDVLLSTGDRYLLEDTTGWHDNIWGDCSCPKCVNKPGQNLLGRALMEVRERLLKEE